MLEVGPMVWLGFNAFALLVTLILLVLAVIFKGSRDEWLSAGAVAAGVTVVISGITAATFYPYNLKYYIWETKEGFIRAVEFDNKARQSSNSNDGGLRVALNDGTVFYTTDFRIAAKSVGEKVSIVCKPSYQHGNVDRLDCRSQLGAM